MSQRHLFSVLGVKGLSNEYDNAHTTIRLERLKAKLSKFYFTFSESAETLERTTQEFRALSSSRVPGLLHTSHSRSARDKSVLRCKNLQFQGMQGFQKVDADHKQAWAEA